MHAVFSRSTDVGGLRDRALAGAAREALDARATPMSPATRARLEQRIDALLGPRSR